MKTLVIILIIFNFLAGTFLLLDRFGGEAFGTTVTQISGADKLSDLDTLINTVTSELNVGKMEISTTTLPLITTLAGLTSATSLATLSALTSVSTITTGTWNALFTAGLIDGDDINSNIAGRSLTLTSASPDTLDVDAELYTRSASANLHATSSSQIATSTNPWLSKYFDRAATITGIFCAGYDSGTSTIKVQIEGTDVLYGSGLQCGADEDIASTTLANTAISAGQRITVFIADAEPTGSRPRLIEVTPVWTIND